MPTIIERKIIETANRFPSFDPNISNADLFVAFARTESSLNPYVSRYEPTYRYLVDPSTHAHRLGITISTETIHQKTSWGVFQIMGAVAREYNYTDYLHLLATAERLYDQLNLFNTHLRRLYHHYKGNLLKTIIGYNKGFGVNETIVQQQLADKYSYLHKILDKLPKSDILYLTTKYKGGETQ